MQFTDSDVGYVRSRFLVACHSRRVLSVFDVAVGLTRQPPIIATVCDRDADEVPATSPATPEDQRTVRWVTRLDAPVAAFRRQLPKSTALGFEPAAPNDDRARAPWRPRKSRVRRAWQRHLPRKRFALGVGPRFRDLRKLSPSRM